MLKNLRFPAVSLNNSKIVEFTIVLVTILCKNAA